MSEKIGIKITDVNNIKESQDTIATLGAVIVDILKSGVDQSTIQVALKTLSEVAPKTSGNTHISNCHIVSEGDTYYPHKEEIPQRELKEEEE